MIARTERDLGATRAMLAEGYRGDGQPRRCQSSRLEEPLRELEGQPMRPASSQPGRARRQQPVQLHSAARGAPLPPADGYRKEAVACQGLRRGPRRMIGWREPADNVILVGFMGAGKSRWGGSSPAASGGASSRPMT